MFRANHAAASWQVSSDGSDRPGASPGSRTKMIAWAVLDGVGRLLRLLGGWLGRHGAGCLGEGMGLDERRSARRRNDGPEDDETPTMAPMAFGRTPEMLIAEAQLLDLLLRYQC